MTSLDDALQGSEEEWLAAVPRHARSTLVALLQAGTGHEEAASIWLSSMGAKDVAHFGVSSRGGSFFDNFKKEIHEFLCGNGKKYQAERAGLLKELKGPGSQALIVGMITHAISPSLGVSAALLGPAVVMILLVIVKVSLAAWCKTMMPPSDEGKEA